MSLNLYLLRHGQTECSRDNVFCGSGTDAGLTEQGHQMASAFAESHRSVPWNAVYVSPMKRAIATAKPLCDAVGIRMEIRDGLKEIHYGKWEGLSADQVGRDFHDEYLRWLADPAWYPPTGGELAVMIARRGLQVVEEIRSAHRDGNVLVVSHKATIRIILCGLLGIDVGRFRYRVGCPVASVSLVEFGTHGPLLHTLADRSHLSHELKSLPGT